MTTKGIPSIPDVPANVKDEDLYRILEPLKRIIDIRQGRFDPLDRWITQQDLIDAGLQTQGAAESSVIVVPGTQQYPFSLTGDVVGGPTQLGTGNPTVMSTALSLPNLVCIDGGASDSTYTPAPSGPYGVAGGGQPIIVQDEGLNLTTTVSLFNFVGAGVTATPAGDQITVTIPGGGGGGSSLETQVNSVSLSTATSLYNFIGFSIVETSPDEFDITLGIAGAADQYCPGYTSYTRVDANEFTVDLVNAENLFYVGRRIRFQDDVGGFEFGNITAVDFNVTSANDTHVTLNMDGGDSVPTTITDVCIVSSATAWSPIATDPFGGDEIREVATGQIGSTQYWVAVGDNGKIFYSTDAGASWTAGTSGHSGNIYTVTFDSTAQRFWAGGIEDTPTGWMAYSTDGATWTSITIPFPVGSNDYIARIRYSLNQDYMVATAFDNSAGNFDNYVSNDQWVNDTTRASGNIQAMTAMDKTGNTPQGYWWYATGTQNFFYTGFTDATASSFSGSLAANQTALLATSSSLVTNTVTFVGLANGQIWYIVVGGGNAQDDVTFPNAIRDFATAQLHARTVCVGDAGQIGYIDEADYNSADSWTSVANGFDPLARINSVDFNEVDGVFVAVASNGQICRSSNGTN